MAFDASLPANSTKIRNYPSVLNANFNGIQQGDSTMLFWKVNCYERNQIGMGEPNTPVRIDNVMQLYSRQNDDTGNTDLYVLDDRATANDIQLTQDGRIGGPSQNFYADLITFNGTINFSENHFVTAWARYESGAKTASNGVDTISASGSEYTVTLSANRTVNTNYVVMATAIGTSGTITLQSITSSTVFVLKRSSAGDFNFIVVGEQQ